MAVDDWITHRTIYSSLNCEELWDRHHLYEYQLAFTIENIRCPAAVYGYKIRASVFGVMGLYDRCGLKFFIESDT